MKRVLTVTVVLGGLLCAAPLAQASWLAGGNAPSANRTAAHTATLKTPVLAGTTGNPKTTCTGTPKKVNANWTLPTGGRTPASYTLTVGGSADNVSIAGTATSATSTGTYSGSKTVTVTANLGSWHKGSNTVTVSC